MWCEHCWKPLHASGSCREFTFFHFPHMSVVMATSETILKATLEFEIIPPDDRQHVLVSNGVITLAACFEISPCLPLSLLQMVLINWVPQCCLKSRGKWSVGFLEQEKNFSPCEPRMNGQASLASEISLSFKCRLFQAR